MTTCPPIKSKLRIISLLTLSILFFACQPVTINTRDFFDTAEKAYKEGKYEEATNNYNKFLESSPDPQLARLAERRLLAIEREIDNVMGRKIGPRPVYANTDEEQQSQNTNIFFQKKQPR